MFIKPTKDAKDLWDFNEDIAGEALLYPVHDEFPCPQDPDISIEGDTVVLTGSIAQGYGSCVCRCTIPQFSELYKLEIPDGSDLEGSGWIEV